ncbi:MAG: hypothetical protein J3K34DRAFT_447417 [Monoraphidium minutum]|nr:MAG: hypothetical protein J3K34DRAFT_447417 [Monoraphidium minutum]
MPWTGAKLLLAAQLARRRRRLRGQQGGLAGGAGGQRCTRQGGPSPGLGRRRARRPRGPPGARAKGTAGNKGIGYGRRRSSAGIEAGVLAMRRQRRPPGVHSTSRIPLAGRRSERHVRVRLVRRMTRCLGISHMTSQTGPPPAGAPHAGAVVRFGRRAGGCARCQTEARVARGQARGCRGRRRRARSPGRLGGCAAPQAEPAKGSERAARRPMHGCGR